MPKGAKVLKIAGRAFFVVEVVVVGAEVLTAPEAEKGRTLARGVGGIAGGALGGAALVSLACGPGALLCFIVAGAIGGLAGGLIGEEIGEGSVSGGGGPGGQPQPGAGGSSGAVSGAEGAGGAPGY
jgi:hypothetical protein